MKKVKIYTTQYCPYCIRVKELFESRGVAFEEIDLTEDPERLQALKDETSLMTVPQVFIGDRFIGGFDETYQLDVEGKLDDLLDSG